MADLYVRGCFVFRGRESISFNIFFLILELNLTFSSTGPMQKSTPFWLTDFVMMVEGADLEGGHTG